MRTLDVLTPTSATSGCVELSGCGDMLADRQTDRQTDMLITILRFPTWSTVIARTVSARRY